MTDRQARSLPQPVEGSTTPGRTACAVPVPALTRTQTAGATDTDTRRRAEGTSAGAAGAEEAGAAGVATAREAVARTARWARRDADAGTAGKAGGEDERTLTPAQAFDALYAFCAPALVRQAYLLTGRHERARAAVEAAFHMAWQRWPEVAHDRDPAGWVRAAAYECALSPWHRLRRRDRLPDPPPDPADRALQDALLRLPPSYRRTLVLYDGVGLDLPETAAETEASTPAAANRLMHAREAVAADLPELADPAELHRRLVRLASAGHLAATGSPARPGASGGAGEASAGAFGGTAGGPSARPAAGPAPGPGPSWKAASAPASASVSASVSAPADVRTAGERSTRFWTRSAIAFTVTIMGATALTLRTAPTHYLAPVSPGHAVQGLPPKGVAAGPLSQDALKLRAELKARVAGGRERTVPEAR
ncbi:sigma factor-like helix-turn-helix DNA-binding protein [Streptomyces sp. NPDC018610]|uniref:sigma factor-like helix-turn-helix DNA-binding protein n=1 Tax=Streptomyces sp. NPDC018610 TaxID=3365049 RepID=UPI003788D191